MAQTKITGDMIADDAVTTALIADDAITTALIADDAVTTALIADDAVTADQLANSINSAITANTAKVTNATHTGDVTGGTALTIAVDAVDIPMLSATGSPSNTTFLRGDNAWAAVPAGVDIQSSAPSVASEGSLYYNTTSNLLYASDGSAWQVVGNLPPAPTGGTVTIPTRAGSSTFNYNLGLNFSDADTPDANLTYTLESGTLPAGAVLPTSGNSALTGTVANTGATYNFVIRATDEQGASSTQAYTQTINAHLTGTGGTITNISGYKVHTFTSSGTFTANSAGIVEYLVIAGGGSGGAQHGGGGGAGGYRTATNFSVAATSYTITVGAGVMGVAGNASPNNGNNGNNSVFSTITSIGGGGGQGWTNGGQTTGKSGGSGGGASLNGIGGSGTAGQGNAGGSSNGSSTYPSGGGGGGGSGSVGQDSINLNKAGNGGSGTASSITGSSVTRAGGGGGGSHSPHAIGLAGSGGGGAGGLGNVHGGAGIGGAATVNTGSGGGASGSNGSASVSGAGASGIVIIRYAV